RIFFALFPAIVGISAVQAKDEICIRINGQDIALSSLKSQTFEAGKTVFTKTDGQAVTVNLSDLYDAPVTFVVASPTGIQPVPDAPRFAVYPNPTGGTVHVQSGDGDVGSVTVYGLSGQVVKTVRINAPTGEIDLSGLNGGVYFLKTGSGHAAKVIRK
ncbi:MAG: T9SS type A sorting domain-containing protein, partial [Tannerella sp.]|nr:T9SS type A sorting domain-containing protein [Tannerella sp.]